MIKSDFKFELVKHSNMKEMLLNWGKKNWDLDLDESYKLLTQFYEAYEAQKNDIDFYANLKIQILF